jgi:uncharacterized membrane protein
MSHKNGSSAILLTVLLTILAIIVPVGAYNVAVYGTNAGFNPALHNDTVVVVQSLPGSPGTDLDKAIDQFVQSSVDVIILGGDDTFSPASAAKLEAAVAKGKILVVTYPCNHLFDKSLPASNGGTSPGGQYLEVASPDSATAKNIFSALPSKFTLNGTAPDKEQVITASDAVIVLNYDTGMPALLYGKYGKGYIIEWTTAPVPSYMDAGTADMVISRLITLLLPAPATTTTVQTTVVQTTVPQTTVVTSNTTVLTTATLVSTTTRPVTTTVPSASGTTTAATGNLSIYSSPLGASVLIDGVYYGVTPLNLTGIPAGSHIFRLTQSGYYDHEGTIYVIAGQTNSAFGTLNPAQYTNGQTTVPTTTVPVSTPVVTAEPTQEKGLLENSSIVVALIGVVTALIAAGASVFTHVFKSKEK